MRAEIKGDEKLLIDLEWPNVMVSCWEFRLYAWAASMYLNTAWLLHDGHSYCSSMYGVMHVIVRSLGSVHHGPGYLNSAWLSNLTVLNVII